MSNRIIICEASEILTTGLCNILQSITGWNIVARLDSPEQLEEKVLSFDANTLIINPIMLGYAHRHLPFQLVKEHPPLNIVALVTTYIEPSTLKPYDAVIELNDSKQKIINKLSQIEKKSEKLEKNEDVELSKREINVLVAVAKGMMNKEIADQMNISIHTVISHRKNITRKTGIKSVSGLTVYALLNNLIDETEVYK